MLNIISHYFFHSSIAPSSLQLQPPYSSFPRLVKRSVLSLNNLFTMLYPAAKMAAAKTTPRGMSSGGMDLSLRRRWETVWPMRVTTVST